MVGQRRGTGVTGDKKKNHLHNYNVFDQDTVWASSCSQVS